MTTLAAEWRTEAACGPETADWFWVDGNLTTDNKRALRLCHTCTVRQQCLADAEAHRDDRWSYIAGGRAFMAARRRGPTSRSTTTKETR